jgi:two-component system, OmpR family, sensor histidine kinase KdpD
MKRRGTLRVYLGAAPGSGKTFAMLREGRTRRAQGEDVVVGFVETYGRPRTVEAIGNLEVLPRLRVEYRGTTLEEMDLDALLARKPEVALVDELAHTNAPGVRHAKRWQDVDELRDAGIDVITTVNVQHVESVKDLVESITGIPVRETVPDHVIDSAEEIHFIDIAPEALRKRMRHGNIYAPDKIDAALSNFFRPGNLGALREIALRLVAQTMGTASNEVRPAPQDVLVAVSGEATSESLIRLGARLARRTDGLCTVVTVSKPRSGAGDDAGIERLRLVSEQVGAAFVQREAADVGRALTQVARELMARHVVIGESRRPTLFGRWRATLADNIVEELPDVDVHVLSRFVTREQRQPEDDESRRPGPDELLRRLHAASGRRALLRIYFGYARGCGTTTAMLDEARRRKQRGTDVVIAAVRTYDRPPCEAALDGLEILGGPRAARAPHHFDLDALLARNPQVACLDDLARLNTGGKPLEDVLKRILDAGITIIATLHLTDLKSTVETMGPLLGYGAGHPTVDDSVLGLADEMELVDVTPAKLTERLRHGEILPPSRTASALQTEFRPQVLAALREMAFRIIAEHTDRQLVAYMRERSIEQPWEARPRVMACVPPRPGMEGLIRLAAKLAERLDAEFKAATVRTRPRSDEEKALLGGYAALTHQLDGEFVTLRETSVPAALAEYARQNLVTEMVVTRGRPNRRFRRNDLRALIRMVKGIDVHIIAAGEG